MKKQRKSIYAIFRTGAWLTQEEAAGLLGVSVHSLSDYETGKLIPPDDVVCLMIEIYQAPMLAYLHLQQSTEVGRRWMPQIKLDEQLQASVLRFQKEMGDVQDLDRQIVAVACDGQIEHKESPIWGRAMVEVKEMVGAGIALIFANKKEKTAMPAAR